jgi:hypothetical protein
MSNNGFVFTTYENARVSMPVYSGIFLDKSEGIFTSKTECDSPISLLVFYHKR